MGQERSSIVKKRQLAEKKRLKKVGLKVVSFHLHPELWKKFKIQLARDRATVRAVTTAMVEFYVKGGFNVEEEKSQADQK